jgi:hypothetical protein
MAWLLWCNVLQSLMAHLPSAWDIYGMGLARFMMLLFFVFSGVVAWKTLGSTPVFNPRMVAETIVGEGRTRTNRFMYDQGEYEYQRGYGFLVADTMTPGYDVEDEELAPPGVLKYRAYKAKDAFEKAITLDPGNARTWVALSWARARLEDFEGAVNALRVSWQIAPNNLTLAKRRMHIAGLLSIPEFGRVVLTEADRKSVAQDANVISIFEMNEREGYEALYPHLFSGANSQAK